MTEPNMRANALFLLLAATILFVSCQAAADAFDLRVGFGDVPGVEEITAGDVKKGIQILEDELAAAKAVDRAPLLVTLCAAYLLDDDLRAAQDTCNRAVAAGRSEGAYNNRGVFRALVGDLAGARLDFDRVRPVSLDVYIEDLRNKDPGLMAYDNYHAIERLINEREAGHGTEITIDTAKIENPGTQRL